MALTYSTDIQDTIALLLVGNTYANLDATQKALMDGTSASSPPTKGVAKDAWDDVNGSFQWAELAGATVSPDAAQRWFIARCCRELALQLRPDRIDQFVKYEKEQYERALSTYSRKAINYDPAADTQYSANTYQNVRYYVVSTLLKRNPPVVLPIDLVDAAINRALLWLWNGYDWPFRRRSVTATITALSAVTFSGSDTFLSLATRRLYFSDVQSYGSAVCVWADGDDMASKLSATGSAASTGRPAYFRYQKAGDTVTWQFWPTPDTTYTATCEIYITGPGAPANATDTAPFLKFPAEFQPWIRELALAEALGSIGDGSSEAIRQRIKDECDRYFPQLADVGRQDDTVAVRNVYSEQVTLTDWTGSMGGAM